MILIEAPFWGFYHFSPFEKRSKLWNSSSSAVDEYFILFSMGQYFLS